MAPASWVASKSKASKHAALPREQDARSEQRQRVHSCQRPQATAEQASTQHSRASKNPAARKGQTAWSSPDSAALASGPTGGGPAKRAMKEGSPLLSGNASPDAGGASDAPAEQKHELTLNIMPYRTPAATSAEACPEGKHRLPRFILMLARSSGHVSGCGLGRLSWRKFDRTASRQFPGRSLLASFRSARHCSCCTRGDEKRREKLYPPSRLAFATL